MNVCVLRRSYLYLSGRAGISSSCWSKFVLTSFSKDMDVIFYDLCYTGLQSSIFIQCKLCQCTECFSGNRFVCSSRPSWSKVESSVLMQSPDLSSKSCNNLECWVFVFHFHYHVRLRADRILIFLRFQTLLQRIEPAGCSLTQTRLVRRGRSKTFGGRQSLRPDVINTGQAWRYETFAAVAALIAVRDRDRLRCQTGFVFTDFLSDIQCRSPPGLGTIE